MNKRRLKRKKWIAFPISLFLLALLGSNSTQAQKAGYQEISLAKSGNIVGTVKYSGRIPSVKYLKVDASDAVCKKRKIPSEELIVSKGKGIKWAVAAIKKIDRGKPFSKENPPKLDQTGCRFVPHVVVVPKAKPLTVLNSDNILHNVHTFAKKNRSVNKAMPGSKKEMNLKLRFPEKVQVKCDVHPWMNGWIVVAKNPYYAVTDDGGNFRLDNVPIGKHTIEIWHEKLGTQTKEVMVKKGKEVLVEFLL